MPVNLSLQQYIKTAYMQMLTDPHHSLLLKQRLPIYHALKNDETFGKKVQGWLAFITAKKVLPIWEEAVSLEATLVSDKRLETIFWLMEALLTEVITVQKVKNDYQDIIRSLGFGLGEDGWNFSNEANYAFFAPDLALAEVMGEFLYKRDSLSEIQMVDNRIELGYPDEMMIALNVDTASMAVCAYSGISFNWDIVNNMPGNELADDQKVLNIVNTTFAPDFKPEKRQEFWEWWLTEAIPQAWELAEQSYQPESH